MSFKDEFYSTKWSLFGMAMVVFAVTVVYTSEHFMYHSTLDSTGWIIYLEAGLSALLAWQDPTRKYGNYGLVFGLTLSIMNFLGTIVLLVLGIMITKDLGILAGHIPLFLILISPSAVPVLSAMLTYKALGWNDRKRERRLYRGAVIDATK